jgi:acyl-CoA synthetase (AMP-forming)/AMP-acid ligase II
MGITQCVKRTVLDNPGGRAIMFGARTRCWDEFATRVARLAGGLRSIGVEPGDRVAILALNSDRYLEAYAAVPWAGAGVVPLNTRWSAAENIYAIDDSGAGILLVDDAFTAVAASILAGTSTVRAVVHLGDAAAPTGMTAYEQLIEKSAEVPDAERTGEDLAGIFYTGGTTGFPKGVMLSHRSLLASAAACARWGFELTRDSVYLHAAPMFHLADFGGTVATLMAGGHHAAIPAFSAERVLAAVEQHRVTHLLLVPTMIHALTAHPKLPTTDMTSLDTVKYG